MSAFLKIIGFGTCSKPKRPLFAWVTEALAFLARSCNPFCSSLPLHTSSNASSPSNSYRQNPLPSFFDANRLKKRLGSSKDDGHCSKPNECLTFFALERVLMELWPLVGEHMTSHACSTTHCSDSQPKRGASLRPVRLD